MSASRREGPVPARELDDAPTDEQALGDEFDDAPTEVGGPQSEDDAAGDAQDDARGFEGGSTDASAPPVPEPGDES